MTDEVFVLGLIADGPSDDSRARGGYFEEVTAISSRAGPKYAKTGSVSPRSTCAEATFDCVVPVAAFPTINYWVRTVKPSKSVN